MAANMVQRDHRYADEFSAVNTVVFIIVIVLLLSITSGFEYCDTRCTKFLTIYMLTYIHNIVHINRRLGYYRLKLNRVAQNWEIKGRRLNCSGCKVRTR
jgi:hypothetical protein